MRSLLIRFFLAFWIIIGTTIGIAALGGYWYAERIRSAYESFEIGDDILEASAALRSAGRDGLAVWLRNYPETQALRLLVLDDRGRDLLNRPVPRHVLTLLRRHRVPAAPPERARRDPENLLRARPLTQLIGPDGRRYTFVLAPARGGHLTSRGAPPRGMLLTFAVLVSAVVSYFLARTMSRPIRKLRSATHDLAAGRLDSRVDPSVGRRRDELGSLAHDFDSMADSLQKAAAQQAELSRNVSHELRSPLARLRVALEIARQKTGDLPELDRIDDESERLNGLIGQILSYTRLDSLSDTDKRRCNVNDLLTDIVADVNFECESAGIEGVSVEASMPDPVFLSLHEDSVRGAVENVLRNAVKHTAANSTISLTLARSGDSVVIEVVDRGPGVDEGDLQHLFEPFFRTPGTQSEGTGLGLAIAQRAIEAHHGSIEARNSAAGGLAVTIRLPASRVAG